MTITGPDISSNQPHPIDFTKVKAAGHTFVIVKAGGDRTSRGIYRNPYFAEDYQQARAAGLVVGAYHWVSPAPAAEQVPPVLALIRDVRLPGDLPVALDFEQSGATHAILHGVRDAYRAAGLPTMTYTYPAFWKTVGDPSCAECAADPLWFAAYQARQPGAPPPWRNVTFWQYAGTSVAVPGIGGLNDMSRFVGTAAQFAALRGSAPIVEDDMAQWWHEADNTEWAMTGAAKLRLSSPAQVRGWQDAGLLSKTRVDVKTDVQKAILAQTPEVKV